MHAFGQSIDRSTKSSPRLECTMVQRTSLTFCLPAGFDGVWTCLGSIGPIQQSQPLTTDNAHPYPPPLPQTGPAVRRTPVVNPSIHCHWPPWKPRSRCLLVVVDSSSSSQPTPWRPDDTPPTTTTTTGMPMPHAPPSTLACSPGSCISVLNRCRGEKWPPTDRYVCMCVRARRASSLARPWEGG